MQPNTQPPSIQQFRTRLAGTDYRDQLLLWALAQEDDPDFEAARTRIAAWLGGTPAEVGARLSQTLDTIVAIPGASPDDACRHARVLMITSRPTFRAPNTKRRQQFIEGWSDAVQLEFDELVNANSMPALPLQVYFALAYLYRDLPGPEQRVKALRHAIARDELRLRLAPVAGPRFEDDSIPPDTVQDGYRRLSRTEQDRIVTLAKELGPRMGPQSRAQLRPRNRIVLERLFPDAKSDSMLVTAFRSAIAARRLDLDRR